MEKHRLPDTPFWVDPESVAPDHLTLGPEESHHLLHVHRAHEGTPFQAIDGEGNFYLCALQSVERRAAVGRILDRARDVGELKRPIEILVGMPDWGAIEQVVAHGVPLGVSAFDFVRCERSGPERLGSKRLGRLGRIARASLKQSRRSRLPVIRSSGSLTEAVGLAFTGGRFVAHPDAPAGGGFGAGSPEASLTLAVGPPGGFSAEEHGLLLTEGFAPISLGPSRLTTETAAMALLSLARNLLLSI